MTETDLFGASAPPPATGGRCAHLNVKYKLSCNGTIEVRSRVEPGQDSVEEVGRRLSWTGLVQGRCEDCGKPLYYTGSSLPKFITRRLRLAEIPEVTESPYLGG